MFDKKGGNVLASGGFGCVFSPALKCKNTADENKSIPSDKKMISKLMLKRHAVEEYEEITKIREKLKDIPNYQDYFLLENFSTCQPGELTSSDLSNYTKKCKALKKRGIKKNNINKQLDKLLILNMPNGGIPVDDFIQKDGSFQKLIKVNELLMELLENGIIPMNKQNVYHSDIKDSNVLIESNNKDNKNNKENKETKMRLIDWGLSTEYTPFKDEPFPKTWRNRPLQYNLPFSIIIFTDDFVKKYTDYIEKGGKINKDDLRPFLLDYIYFWFKERGVGHYKIINEIMYILFSRELKNIDEEDKYKIIENEFTVSYIVNYITEILIHYTKFRENGNLNLRHYLDNVFVDIVDIWGFVSIYIPILIIFDQNYEELNNNQLEVFELLKDILINHLYSPRIQPNNIEELLKDLRKLDKLLGLENKLKNIISDKKSLKKQVKNKTKKIVFEKSKTKTKRFKSFVLVSSKTKK